MLEAWRGGEDLYRGILNAKMDASKDTPSGAQVQDRY
jgi:hypothetical protein